MALYEQAIPAILKWEGGYVNDPSDRGGETYRGISRKNHPRWTGWAIIDTYPEEQKHHNREWPELEDKVKAFYRAEYWNKIMGGQIKDQKVAGFLLDWFVHSGYHAIKNLQRIIGQLDDGVMGIKTITAINKYDGDLFGKLKEARIKFVHNIAKTRPSQPKFLKGWLNRIEDFS
jgi:lysozyme family protein